MNSQPFLNMNGSGGHDDVMRQFQQLMSQFLQTQALVMTTYFQGVGEGVAPALLPTFDRSLTSAAPRADVGLAAPQPAAVSYGQSAGVLSSGLPRPEATNHGGLHMAAPPVAPPEAAAPSPVLVAPVVPSTPVSVVVAAKATVHPRTAASLTEADVLKLLLRIVSDRTGYPEDMLAPDANIEADLGIDSIKRMEILAAFHENHGGSERGAFQEALERLTALKTLGESAAALTVILSAQSEAAVA